MEDFYGDYVDPEDDWVNMRWWECVLLGCFFVCLMIVDFFAERKNLFTGLLLIAALLAGEFFLVRFAPAKYVSMLATVFVGMLVTVFVNMALENENHRARSLIELWRKTKTLGPFMQLSYFWAGVAAAFALVVQFQTEYTVYAPGAILIVLAGPITIIGCGLLTVRSFVKIEKHVA